MAARSNRTRKGRRRRRRRKKKRGLCCPSDHPPYIAALIFIAYVEEESVCGKEFDDVSTCVYILIEVTIVFLLSIFMSM